MLNLERKLSAREFVVTAELPVIDGGGYGEILRQLEPMRPFVDAYNATDNPGKYALREGADGQFAVVGTGVRDETGALQAVRPILDTPLIIKKQARNVHDTVEVILGALSAPVGKNVIMMSVPNNLFRDLQVIVGGDNIPARQLLREAFDGTHRPLQYDLGFDPDNSPTYILNVSVAVKAEGEDGRRRIVPIDRPR